MELAQHLIVYRRLVSPKEFEEKDFRVSIRLAKITASYHPKPIDYLLGLDMAGVKSVAYIIIR